MAYVYAQLRSTFTILVLAVNSTQFWVLRTYALLVYVWSNTDLVEILKQNDKFWTYFLWMIVATTWQI